MSFTKSELEDFAKDYAPEEGVPAIVVDHAAAAAVKRLNDEPLFLDVEAIAQATTMQPQTEEKPKQQPRVGGKFARADGTVNPKSKKEAAPKTNVDGLSLFLIEGTVRLQPNAPGRGAVQSKQTRIVWAADIDEAIGKFMNYFQELSDSQSTYVVVGAGGTEAIS